MSAALQGKILWHELLTVDTGAAASFYAAALGWKVRAWEHDPAYGLVETPSSGVLGGLRHLPGGGQPHWLPFVGVADIAASVARAEGLGAKVLQPVTEITGTGGRYAVLADPHGNAIGIYHPAQAQHADGSPMEPSPAPGWHELGAPSGEAALGFYRDLFGWQLAASHDMGPAGKYLILGLADKQFGGLFTSQEKRGWLVYFRVPGAAEAVAAVKAAGGKVLREPMEVPGGGWIAQFLDPQGALFAVMSSVRSAAKPAPAAAKPTSKPKPVAAKPAAAPAPKVAPASAAPATKAKSKAKTKAKAAAKSAAKAKLKAKPAPKAKTKAKSKARKKAKTKSKAKTQAKSSRLVRKKTKAKRPTRKK